MVPRLIRHVRTLWPGAGVYMPLPFLVWSMIVAMLGGFRIDHLLFVLVVPLLAYSNVTTKKLFLGLYPIGLVGVVFDGMRYWKDLGVTEERVHLCDLRAVDQRIFPTSLGTVHDWLQAHASKSLDLLCAVPYGTFIPVSIVFAVYLYVKDYKRMVAFTWTFALLNFAGFITYHVYPAAPPWYFHAHGCAVDLASHASEGPNLARVDQWLGFSYFGAMYGRSSDVFGAMPSLHVAYPMLIVLFGWPVLRWPGRALATLFLVTMCFAAVYLDHHWIVDVVVGLAYTLAVFAAVHAIRPAGRVPREAA